ncbi:hypothetical protein PTSG_01907 [Salpingoeca rosetta]|uniref:Fe2OG dioxygenase domain-containing protein n=1 Tax=Salpingoeca rosetta (strain ATCC 50818 / BSB-021) TaxID=946362 RepID=F2TZA8_SALR5|nr:uncharacterized protein PTSG_01907 [Salpingoeca rosetta]EGD78932.1 hypothetical protein PTSG_01907 [Salpingoeca rosetta]|eukprot:XP_004997888.1 hypothetical protein PTSG_01907 [Salpingoeca rosetta]
MDVLWWWVERAVRAVSDVGDSGNGMTWVAIACLAATALLYVVLAALLGNIADGSSDDNKRRQRHPHGRGGGVLQSTSFKLVPVHPSYPAPRGQLVPQCQCFLTDNYFIDKLGGREVRQHVSYNGDDEAFCKKNARLLRSWTADELNEALAILRDERARREHAAERSKERRERIKAEYTFITRCKELQLHHLRPEIRSLMTAIEETWTMDGRLPPTTNAQALVGTARLLELSPGIYAVPMFTAKYCAELEKELSNFRHVASKDLKQSINSMNKHGVSLHELGFTPTFSNVIMASIANPLVEALYGAEFATLDHHKCFTVEYGEKADTDLSLHYDHSLITFNICITSLFEGGDLQFFGDSRAAPRDTPVTWRHRCGWAVIHRGRGWHRALPVRYGHRTNIIMWLRSRRHSREVGCDMCGKPVVSK